MTGTTYTITLVPNGYVSGSLNGVGDSPNHKCVDDPVGSPDEDTTYVKKENVAGGFSDTYHVTNHDGSASACVIDRIDICVRAKRGSTSLTRCRAKIVTHSSNYYGSWRYPNLSYLDYWSGWVLNPYTGNAWTWDEINDMYIGLSVENYTSLSKFRCTQEYLRVTYRLETICEDTVTLSDELDNKADFKKELLDNVSLSDVFNFFPTPLRLLETIKVIDDFIGSLNKPLYYYQPSSTSQFTLNEFDVLAFSGIEKDDKLIRNDIIVIGDSVSATTSDSVSISSYGRYSYRYENTDISNSNDAVTIAGQILENYKDVKIKGWVKIKGRTGINPRNKFTLNLPSLGINNQLYEVVQYSHKLTGEGFYTTIYFGEVPWDITREVTNLTKKVY